MYQRKAYLNFINKQIKSTTNKLAIVNKLRLKSINRKQKSNNWLVNWFAQLGIFATRKEQRHKETLCQRQILKWRRKSQSGEIQPPHCSCGLSPVMEKRNF